MHNDPVVIRHAEALLHSTPEGACASVEADLRAPDVIVAEAARTLDFGKPVALLFIQVLHFIPDSDDPYGIVARLVAALPPGSFLCLIQAKRWTGLVGLESVHALTGIMAATTPPPSPGTTSWFGRASEKFAKRNRITLINGAVLKQLIKDHLKMDVIPRHRPAPAPSRLLLRHPGRDGILLRHRAM